MSPEGGKKVSSEPRNAQIPNPGRHRENTLDECPLLPQVKQQKPTPFLACSAPRATPTLLEKAAEVTAPSQDSMTIIDNNPHQMQVPM